MILIVSSDEDPHAVLVGAGLQKLNQRFQIWNPAASPLRQATTLELNHELEFFCDTEVCQWNGRQPEVVWCRREGEVSFPSQLPLSSREIFKREVLYARRCAFNALESFGAVWVNSWTNARRADNKILQLLHAKRMGLKVPHTLVSNSPDRIRSFYESCGGRVIHKMFHSAVFDGECVACTTVVPADAMKQSSSLAICPAIYQSLVSKKFDVRVLVMGSTVLCVKLEGGGNEVDIRASRALTGSRMDLPTDVAQACLRLVRSLGLLTGSIDLAYTSDGEWIFFEVNESGQFLWLETLVPEVPTLDAFCHFLCAPSEEFTYKPSGRRIDANELLETEFANGSQIQSNNSTIY
jgi:glutathione synthase/RimK-type ligase-like ATP-grasp enzyme